MKRAVAFLDGQNVHNSLKALGLQEKDVDWARLFARVLPDGHELVRCYWYHVRDVSEFDPATPKAARYCPPGVDEEAFLDEARRWHQGEHERLMHLQRVVHRQIMLDFDAVEFRYRGVLRVNAFKRERLGEKGLDVGMAADMVALVDHFDTAILFSGDADFAPVVQVLKDRMRRVVQVTIERGAPGSTPRSAAREMRVLADSVRTLFEDEITDRKQGLLRS